eukprot:TRINITY_DN37418_c0_g1_i1.p1 TRINITY_DN37418_c0_g1~~TRINITY_DN37418_c0_g1_i1.p1  ORF type:complete len:133 (-),score=26.08 TRINITY_DN37418_c0_g1_i1:213-569(-)
MDFEQFVFPFMVLFHEPGKPELFVHRLQICRTYLSASQASHSSHTPGAPPRIAAGFTAAALLRCLGKGPPRPSDLLCGICADLMELLAVEDSELRAQIARILGLFDLQMPAAVTGMSG